VTAGAGAAGAGAGGDAGGGEALNGSAEGGPHIGALTGQLETLGAGMEEMRAFLQGQVSLPDLGEDGENPDLGWVDDDFVGEKLAGDPYGPDAADDGTEQIANELADVFGQHVEQAVAPLHDEIDRIRQEGEFRSLVEEFPDIGNPEVAEPLFRTAADFASVHGPPRRSRRVRR
jgi:hypothetical protein